MVALFQWVPFNLVISRAPTTSSLTVGFCNLLFVLFSINMFLSAAFIAHWVEHLSNLTHHTRRLSFHKLLISCGDYACAAYFLFLLHLTHLCLYVWTSVVFALILLLFKGLGVWVCCNIYESSFGSKEIMSYSFLEIVSHMCFIYAQFLLYKRRHQDLSFKHICIYTHIPTLLLLIYIICILYM